MDQVNKEVGQLWGGNHVCDLYLGDGTTRYSDHNIEYWLIKWHLFSQIAETRLSWTIALADMKLAIDSCEPKVQEFFEYYCLIGYTYEEIMVIMDCSRSTCKWYWWQLRRSVCKKLQDSRVIHKTPTGRGSMPESYAFSAEGKFPQNPDRL